MSNDVAPASVVSCALRLATCDSPDFWRTGHVVYESGDHGDVWLALELLFADPVRLRADAERLAARLRPFAPEVVCGPLVGGALLGQPVAEALGATFVYAEPQPTMPTGTPRSTIPAGARPLLAGKRVAIVDDSINVGAATLAALSAVEEAGGRVVAVGSLLVREPGGVEIWRRRGLPFVYLIGLTWNIWPAGECPLCRTGAPIERSS